MQKRDTGKEAWGDGPWKQEPDRSEWRARNGLACLAVRHPRGGHWCGYVGVSRKHPLAVQLAAVRAKRRLVARAGDPSSWRQRYDLLPFEVDRASRENVRIPRSLRRIR